MKKQSLIYLFLLISFGTACAGIATPPENQLAFGPSTWIDAPLDGSTIPLAEFTVISHASDADGISAFELSVNGQVISVDLVEANQQALAIAHISQAWLPPVPGTYLLGMRAANTNGEYGPIAFAKVSVGGEQEAEQAPAASPSPSELTLIAVPLQNANCRLGPSSSSFETVDILFMGTEYSPIAQGQDQVWLLFDGPDYDGNCWVFVESLDLFCGEAAVEIADVSPCELSVEPYPLFPTATPTLPDEPTNTPAPHLPECSDGIDNDGDGDIDMADGRCVDPSDDSENS